MAVTADTRLQPLAPNEWRIRDRTFRIARPLVMGIVNVTPDSFSDGGKFVETAAAIAHGRRLLQEGADILDIGGESTRPGATPVPADEETRRVLPVVEALAGEGAVVSIDTSKASVAAACLEAGAGIVNDVTALTGDPEMINVVRKYQPGVILMHMRGTPQTMQLDPRYDDVVREVRSYLAERIEAAVRAGIEADRLAIDPGIGFGKRTMHNVDLLAHLTEFQKLGRPLCLGVSRKGFIGKILGRELEERMVGSLAVAAFAMCRGAVQILRVHDVAATRDLVVMWQYLADAAESAGRDDHPEGQ